LKTQTDRADQQIKLTDGRRLGYAEYGHPDGRPVFFCHGFPGSRIDWLMFDSDDSSLGSKARIIAIDRPGIGLSDFQDGRSFLDWPSDVIELADVLKLDKFAVLAVSGGGPYGEVCAYKIPDRLTATAIVSGMGPADAPGATEGESWAFPGKMSLIRRLILMLMVQGLKRPDKMLAQVKGSFTGPDAALMEKHPELAEGIVASWQEAFRSGISGVHHEAGLYTRPWGFNLQDITAPVYLWHGGAGDKNVLSSVGRYVAESIPNCQATFLEEEGHFSLVYNHIDEILRILVS
jgi:pimeloyl-ACP methyl ester carboxylesterase